jgi:hypothetical protein
MTIADRALRLRIGQVNKKWNEVLGSEKCPAVLGLLGLSEDECAEVSELVSSLTEDYPPSCRFILLKQLLLHYPAIIAVWLATPPRPPMALANMAGNRFMTFMM